MAFSESLTQKWLRQNIHSYLHKDRVFVDINAALARFNALRPKLDVYTHNDGRTQLLLCVHGVLPILFRRVSYNIPVALWITRDYPKQPPIAYVVPTNDMLVKPGRYVDVSGKCDPEYIHNWERKTEGCSLSGLLEAMQDQFSREPPLFSKPKDRPTPPPASASAHDRPALPPKPRPSPNQSSSLGSPLHHSGSQASQLNSIPTVAKSPIPPTLPGPPSIDARPPQYRSPPRSPAVLPTYLGSEIAPPPPTLHQPIPTNASWHIHASTPTVPMHHSFSPASNPADSSTGVVVPLTTSLLDEDSPVTQPVRLAPPRPPNPELLQLHGTLHDRIGMEMDSLSQALALDAERLRTLQTDLLAGEPAIRDEMARLEAVRDVCYNVGGKLKDRVQQAERNIGELRRKGDPEIDEMVCATSIVHNQLINLVAEDNAIEDTIYQLHRALNAGRIDLERFLRTTRVLAEEQFMKRALVEKITIGMPSDQSGGSGWS
ncbi:hypothetical protein AX17_003366 [Amanita inopinata Kibby_2008]|nr:hypothetical protein AX17_003366 [Amanita inopinata Kibby_2008]